MSKILIVAGGGAAGFFCAVNAGRIHPGLKVILLEKSSKLLSKVKVSGGGRCNLTHACFDRKELVNNYPRGRQFVKKAFYKFFTEDTILWFTERGVSLKTEADGRMFPDTDSSQTVIDCLLREAKRYGVEIHLRKEMSHIEKVDDQFHLMSTDGERYSSDYLCIATGGFSKLQNLDWLKKLGHSVEEPVPSLFTFNLPDNLITRLMGITLGKARVRIRETSLSESGPLLITHWGFSGPVVLRLSAWGARELAELNYQFSIAVDWVTEIEEQRLRDHLIESRHSRTGQKITVRNEFDLPGRLWEYLVEMAGISRDLHWQDLSNKLLNVLVQHLKGSIFEVKGKTTFKEEFVTAGGIRLSEIDPQTMQSRICPGLFFAGEVMDVDGITGGFNFQHAWTSGYIAASAIAGK
jgi:hypothetical protein